MSNYKKWVTAGVVLTIASILTGCGNIKSSIDGVTQIKTTNQTNFKATTNTPTATNSKFITTKFMEESVIVQPGTTVIFKVPHGWNKQNVGAGDTGGLEWVNPANLNQWVRVLYSGDAGALFNNRGKYDVTSFINNIGITWTFVSSDNLSGKYTVSVGAINNKSVGYGYAQVITKPFPLGVRVDVVAPQKVAQSIVRNVIVSTKSK